jgi:hypothetical protein
MTIELNQTELSIIWTSLSHRIIRIDEMIEVFKNHQDEVKSQLLMDKYLLQKDDVQNLLDKLTEIN